MTYKEDIDQFWGNQWLTNQKGLEISSYLTQYKFIRFIKPILDLLPLQSKVCEIGSGNCQWLSYIRSYRPDLQLYGIDLADSAQQFASKFGITCIQSDIRDTPLQSSYFEFTYSWGVIEHMLDSDRAFSEQYRISRTFVVVDVPCRNSLPSFQIRRNIRKRNLTDYEAMIEFGRLFTRSEFRNLIKSVCNPTDSIQFMNNFLAFPNKSILGCNIGHVLDRLTPGVLRSLIGQNIGAIIQKK